jgi:hypothetical protein
MTFKLGDWIEHTAFGTGLITEDCDLYFVIRFVSGTEKKLKNDFVVTPGYPPHPQFTFSKPKRAKSSGTKTAKKPHSAGLSFEHLLERFTAVFPEGFENPEFDADERQYKEAAVANLVARPCRGARLSSFHGQDRGRSTVGLRDTFPRSQPVDAFSNAIGHDCLSGGRLERWMLAEVFGEERKDSADLFVAIP